MRTGYHVTTCKGLIFQILRQDQVKFNKSQQHSTTWRSASYLDRSHIWWLCKTNPKMPYSQWGTRSPQLWRGTTKHCKVRTFTSFGYRSACSLQRITRVVQLPYCCQQKQPSEKDTQIWVPSPALPPRQEILLIPLVSIWKSGFLQGALKRNGSFKKRFQKHPSAIQNLMMKVFCFLGLFFSFLAIFIGR